MKKEYTTTLTQPFLTLETTGLSPQKDIIFLIGLINHKKGICEIYLCDHLTSEYEMLQKFIDDHDGDYFITWEGNDFSKRFLQERCNFYGIQHQISFCNLSQKVKKLSFLFPLSSFSKSSLEEYFHLPPSSNGKQMAKMYPLYFKKELTSEDLSQEAIHKLSALSELDHAITNAEKEQLSFSILGKYGEITSLKKEGHLAILQGTIRGHSNLFLPTSAYVLSIEEENFQLEIPMSEAPYDHRICSYVLREDFYELSLPSQIPSPSPILILYLEEWIFPHLKALTERIFFHILKRDL